MERKDLIIITDQFIALSTSDTFDSSQMVCVMLLKITVFSSLGSLEMELLYILGRSAIILIKLF